MNKRELIEAVSKETGYTKVVTEYFVDTFVSTIMKNVKKNESVKIAGFGAFSKIRRKSKGILNPQTKEPMVIPAKNAPKFRAYPPFLEYLV